jgi:hypothetical protein
VTHQVLDQLLEMLSGGLSLLLPADDHNQLCIIVTGFLGEYHTGSKLVSHPADVGTLTSDEKAMILWLAANLQSVMFLCLEGR